MAKTAILLFAHGAGFCKEIWDPVMRRLRESPLLQGATKTRLISFDFKYHGTNRDEGETPQVDLSDPEAPRVYHAAGDLTTWTSAEVLRRVQSLQREFPNSPLIGVGHSMGACALWKTEVLQPGTFDGLVLFEPVYGDMNVDMVTNFLVSITLKRQSSWPSREAAEEHLRTFKNFANWDRESLDAYIKGGLVDDKATGKTVLACSPAMEASLYCHKLMFCTDEELAGCKSKVFIHSGARSKMFLSSIFDEMHDKWPHTYSVGEPIPRGSHVMVVEHPSVVAQRILDSLEQLDLFRDQLVARL